MSDPAALQQAADFLPAAFRSLLGYGVLGMLAVAQGWINVKFYLRIQNLADNNSKIHEAYAEKNMERLEKLAAILADNTKSNENVARSHDTATMASDRFVRALESLLTEVRSAMQEVRSR